MVTLLQAYGLLAIAVYLMVIGGFVAWAAYQDVERGAQIMCPRFPGSLN